jgi:hypothetical protein
MSVTKYDKAWKLIEATGWCQGESAKDDRGRSIYARHPQACSFCLMGAIDLVYDVGNYSKAFIKVLEAVNKLEQKRTYVSEWNDDPERTKEEVVNLLKGLDI